jgi:Flp pilus assembly protein TadD
VKLTDALLADREPDEALASGRQGLSLHPADPDLHNSVGAVLVAQGKLEEAEAEFRLSIRTRADHLAARYNLGWVLEQQGRLDEAIREYEVVLRIDPQNGPARARLESARGKRAG